MVLHEGIFSDSSTGYYSEVEGAGDFAFDGNCCNTNDITRSWVAVDNCGNETVFVQTIEVVDEEAPVFFNIPESVVLHCGDEIPAAPDNVFAVDNCDTELEIEFTETQSSEFWPFVITRTWTVTDDCGNQTVAVQTITVEYQAAPDFHALAYPNPFIDFFGFEFSFPKDEMVKVKVIDMLGKEMMTIYDGEAKGGSLYKFNVEQVYWESGVYTVAIFTESKVFYHKILTVSK